MSEEIVSREPATGQQIWSGPVGDPDAEVAAACEAWPAWAARPLTVRVELVRRFVNAVRAKSDELADRVARETGRPLWEARTEIEAVVDRIDVSVAAYADRTSQRRLDGAMGARNAVRHKPVGVVAVITSFCFPAALPTNHIIPALIAGNAVVLKPSEKATATAAMLVDCFRAAGIPEGVVRMLVGGPAQGAALAVHPNVNAVLFTGSLATGYAIHRSFIDLPHRLLSLEMGGNNPIIAWDTPEIASSAAMIVQSAFMGAGQRCTAARRLIVRDGGHAPLLDEIGKLVERMIVGGPTDSPAPFMGALIDNAAADRVSDAFMEMMMKGARPLAHMQRVEKDKPFLRPGIIDVTNLQARPDTEHFGPLLQVIRVPDFDAAIKEANATRYGLGAGLIGGSPDLYDRFWANSRAGMVNWNRPINVVPAAAPLGGLGCSGNYRPGGYYAADHVAYPVISSESEQVRASVGIGLSDA